VPEPVTAKTLTTNVVPLYEVTVLDKLPPVEEIATLDPTIIPSPEGIVNVFDPIPIVALDTDVVVIPLGEL
jgi:hypothetical protein